MDEKIVVAICRTLDIPIITFTDAYVDRPYIIPLRVKHPFVVEVMNQLGIRVDVAEKISDSQAVAFSKLEFANNRELYNFIETTLLPLFKEGADGV